MIFKFDEFLIGHYFEMALSVNKDNPPKEVYLSPWEWDLLYDELDEQGLLVKEFDAGITTYKMPKEYKGIELLKQEILTTKDK
jgi:hypothetical protein